MKNKSTRVRKFREYPPVRKVGVSKGHGPRHAENVLEGEEVEPVKLAGGDSNLKPGWVNDIAPLPEGGGGGVVKEWNAGDFEKWIEGQRPSTAATGSSGFTGTTPPPSGVDIPPADVGSPDPASISGGPFGGWTPDQMNAWHDYWGPSQLNYPSFTGTTAGPGGEQLAFETTSYDVPGMGWTPQAQLANAQASNNFWDYMNPWGHTTKGGEGTGVPTQKAVGTAVGTLTNVFVPGFGYVTGPIARWITSKLQGGMSKGDIGRVVARAQAKLPPMPSGSVDLPQHGTSTSGGGGYYSPNYLRSIGYAPGQGTGSLWPGGAPFSGGFNVGGYGVGGGGGSFFHQLGGSRGGPLAGGGSGASGPSNLTWGGAAFGGEGTSDRPHFNPFFGGYNQNAPSKGVGVALRAKGDSDVDAPLNAWGEGRSLWDRVKRDFGDPIQMGKKADEDLMHFLAQFGAPTERERPIDESVRKMREAMGKNLEPVSDEEMMRRYPGLKLAKGKTKVGVKKGFGPRHAENAQEGEMPNTDTVPAMLTPREAVLNRNAAELAGRGNIEKLNAEGNKLAEKGVDLAAKGDTDVDTTKREPIEVGTQGSDEMRRLLGPWFDEFIRYQQAMRRGELSQETALPLEAGFERRLSGGGGNEMARFLHEKAMERAGGEYQEGTKNVKEKAKKLQGGTDAVKKPMYNSIGGGVPSAMPPDQIGGAPGPQPPLWWQHKRNMAQQGPGLDWQHRRNMAINRGFDQPAMPPQYMPMPGQSVEPAGGGGFYPKGMGMQSGEAEVQGPIGSPNPQQAYGPPITLTAPQLQQAAQKAGLSGGQIQGLMTAVQGFGQAYGAATGGGLGGGGTGGMDAAGAFQGGISDIGYPPFVAPNAEYHADKGSSWIGRYDPAYTLPIY